MSDIPQERRLVTAIPGPKSAELQARRVAAVAAGVGSTLPVFTARAGGGIIEDVDGNRLIDFGSGIAVTSVGASAEAVVRRASAQLADFTHTCFMVTPYEGYVEVCEQLAELTPGDHAKKSALFNSGSEAVENAVKIATENVAAVIIEPIQGEGGFVVPAEGFLPALATWCSDNGIVFIADEIQTGFCRTGDWFACDREGVVPDLITTAKGIAGGLPLAAVTGRAELMDAVHAGGLGGTYGGNPVACAAALGTIATMRELDLPDAARAIEDTMLTRLRAIASRHPAIGDIRGRGAMIAVELVKPGTTEPDAALTGAIAKACHAQGVVVLTAGSYGNVLRFLPPLVI